MPKRPTRPPPCPSPQWARALQRWKPRHSCRGGRPQLFNAFLTEPLRLSARRSLYSRAFPPREDTQRHRAGDCAFEGHCRQPLPSQGPESLTTVPRGPRMSIEGNPGFPCACVGRFPLLGSQERPRGLCGSKSGLTRKAGQGARRARPGPSNAAGEEAHKGGKPGQAHLAIERVFRYSDQVTLPSEAPGMERRPPYGYARALVVS